MNAARLSATFAIALTLGAGVGACGGGKDPSARPPTTAPPEPVETAPATPAERDFPAEFVKRVEPICTDAQAAVDKLSPIEDPAAVAKAAGAYKDAAARLDKLDPPQENAEAYRRFVEVYRDAGDTLGRLEAEIRGGDSSALERVPSILDDVNTERGDIASEYGFDKCTAG